MHFFNESVGQHKKDGKEMIQTHNDVKQRLDKPKTILEKKKLEILEYINIEIHKHWTTLHGERTTL